MKNALKSLRRRTQAGVARSNVEGTTPDHLAEWATLDFNPSSGVDQQNDTEKSYNDSSLSQSFVSNGSINEKQGPAPSEIGTSAPAQPNTISKTPSLSESWSTLGMQTHKVKKKTMIYFHTRLVPNFFLTDRPKLTRKATPSHRLIVHHGLKPRTQH